MTVIGETQAIAQEKYEYLQSLIDPEAQRMLNSALMGVDLSQVASPEEMRAKQGNQGIVGSQNRVLQVMKAEGIAFQDAVAKPRSLLVGTPSSIADTLEEWFTAGACDGFIITPTVHPRMFEEFCRLVVPQLQRRGLFRREYAGATLRENLARG
jgi:alkanesulfonate monooxygenase SsuD/methylene tetrahydromethanopterin reductase-like flavin-dependent oxidoreductase (luciferase family)